MSPSRFVETSLALAMFEISFHRMRSADEDKPLCYGRVEVRESRCRALLRQYQLRDEGLPCLLAHPAEARYLN